MNLKTLILSAVIVSVIGILTVLIAAPAAPEITPAKGVSAPAKRAGAPATTSPVAAVEDPPQAYIMGDSLIDDLEKNGLHEAFLSRGWRAEIKARRGRTILTWSRPSGYEQAVMDTEIIRKSQAVVIGLGVNNEPGDITDAMKKLLNFIKGVTPENTQFYWLSLYNKGKPREIPGHNNAMQHVSATPGYEFTIIPWYSKIVENPSWLEDQVHLWPLGSWYMSQFIAEQVTG